MKTSIVLRHIVFTGKDVPPARLDFINGLNLIYGASNTGKSFVLKAIDFMFGGSNQLPEIDESKGYEQIFLGFEIEDDQPYTLERSIKGGGFNLYSTLLSEVNEKYFIKVLAPDAKTKKIMSLPEFFLEKIKLVDKRVAKNAIGVTENLSFRDVIALSLVDETSIQSERSPIESELGPVTKTKERSVFRMILSGQDDSKIIALMDDATFKTSKNVKIELVQSLLDEVEEKIKSNYPYVEELEAQLDRLNKGLDQIQSAYDEIQSQRKKLTVEKNGLEEEILKGRERFSEIEIHQDRFRKLERVYSSDIERLESLEESGFLISMMEKSDCPLCGSAASFQKNTSHEHSLDQIRTSAEAEIKKIKKQQSDLVIMIKELALEKNSIVQKTEEKKGILATVEKNIQKYNADINDRNKSIKELLLVRDHSRDGIELLSQKQDYLKMIEGFEALKKPLKKDQPALKPLDNNMFDLSNIISEVLKEWGFPGTNIVQFEEKSYDLKIDGKLRINNGKGVRAITHTAFKVSLLIYCRKYNLPHPGFIVIDSPLLTYRDPIKNPNLGELTEDEMILKKSDLREKFFKHLSSISDLGQFIIFENIDPPADIQSYANVAIFYGNKEASTSNNRSGFFPDKKC